MPKIRVLCFGDSNTWGYDPKNDSRYPESIRWTGVLQKLLGPKYQIIEEGLNGRTTAFDYENRPGKNGLTYFKPCLESHDPLDIVIICLGTNDAKAEFDHSAETISNGLEKLVAMMFGSDVECPTQNIRVIVAAPTYVEEAHIGDHVAFIGAEAKTKKLPALYEKIAAKHGATFVDLSKVASPCTTDGCHLEPKAHEDIAKALYEKIIEL